MSTWEPPFSTGQHWLQNFDGIKAVEAAGIGNAAAAGWVVELGKLGRREDSFVAGVVDLRGLFRCLVSLLTLAN